MADITNRTQDITIFEKDGNKAVDVITDGSIERLAVDAKVNISNVQIGAVVNVANILRTIDWVINTKASTVLDTYVVPTGKKFLLTSFQVNADHPLALNIYLNVNGTTKILYFLDPPFGADNRQTNYACPVQFGTAGDTITIEADPSMARGEINVILTGIEIDI